MIKQLFCIAEIAGDVVDLSGLVVMVLTDLLFLLIAFYFYFVYLRNCLCLNLFSDEHHVCVLYM